MKKIIITAISAIAVIALFIGCQVYDQNSNETIYTAMNRDSAISWEKYAKPINDKYKLCADAITHAEVGYVTAVSFDVTSDRSSGSVTKTFTTGTTQVEVKKGKLKLLDYTSDTVVDRIKDIMKDTTIDTGVDLIKGIVVEAGKNIDSDVEQLLEEFLKYDEFITIAKKKVGVKEPQVDLYDVEAVKNAYMTSTAINAKARMKVQIVYAKAKYLKDTDKKSDVEIAEMIAAKKLDEYAPRVEMEGVSLKDLWDKENKLKWDWNSVK